MNSVFGIVKINARQSKIAYWIVGVFAFSQLVQGILVFLGVPNGPMPIGNTLYLLPLLVGIFIPALNFTKLMNLGGKRLDFFKASVLNYAIIAACVTLASLVLHYTFDRAVDNHALYIMRPEHIEYHVDLNLWNVFGFAQNGAVIAFIQMWAFLMLLSVVAHTLTLAQRHWYGIAADILIIAIISVFTPIAPLRAALVWFFNMIIFHDTAVIQILSCLVLGAVIYAASLIPIKAKST
jgi:hypothetical protein